MRWCTWISAVADVEVENTPLSTHSVISGLIYLCFSGIGPRDHLLTKGIPVLRDLPAVGSYLVRVNALPTIFDSHT